MIELFAALSVSLALTGKKIAHMIISETIIFEGMVTARLNPS